MYEDSLETQIERGHRHLEHDRCAQLEHALGEARRERDAALRAVDAGIETEDALRAEIERYSQRSRDEDTTRIRLNHARIKLREALEAINQECEWVDDDYCAPTLPTIRKIAQAALKD